MKNGTVGVGGTKGKRNGAMRGVVSSLELVLVARWVVAALARGGLVRYAGRSSVGARGASDCCQLPEDRRTGHDCASAVLILRLLILGPTRGRVENAGAVQPRLLAELEVLPSAGVLAGRLVGAMVAGRGDWGQLPWS